MKQIHEYPSLLEIMEGLMGAGKSYFAVRRLISTLQEQSRPVYTNLPLKLQVLRKYLRDRHGEEVANLVHNLTERHWRAFIRRQHKFSEFKTECEESKPCELTDQEQREIFQACQDTYPEHPPTLQQIQRSERFYINWIIALFDKRHGAPIDSGPNANHIPPASIIIIDELQRWHPMMNQSNDPDRQNLLSYVTMSRHHAHWIWVLTQDAMNICIDFRRLAHQYWVIWNRTEDEIAGPLRFKHLGFGRFKIRAMGYARFTHEGYAKLKSSVVADKRTLAVEAFSIITNLPGSKLFYRFYSSETHLGSRRQLQKKLREGQRRAGITDKTLVQPEPEEETLMFKIVKRFYLLLSVLVLVAGGFFVGKQMAEPTVEAKQKAEVITWPKWTMVSSTPWIAGRPTKIDQPIGETRATLKYISDDNRALVMLRDDEYWLWNFGSDPILVGAREDVRAAVAGIQGYDSTGYGSSE